MKSMVLIVVGCVLGCSAGWYFGYTRPVAENQRKLLKEYQLVRDTSGYTDAEMAEAAETWPKPSEVLASMAREDELIATLALATVVEFERNGPEAAKHRLLHVLGSYYRFQRSNDLYTNLIARIEKAALNSPSVAAEIAKESESRQGAEDAATELRPGSRAGAPPAAGVLESSETMNTNPESEAPADGDGR